MTYWPHILFFGLVCFGVGFACGGLLLFDKPKRQDDESEHGVGQ